MHSQVMQQKSHEMLEKSEEAVEEPPDGCVLDRLMVDSETETRRMLAAAEEALAAEWPRIAPGTPLPPHLAPPLPPPDVSVYLPILMILSTPSYPTAAMFQWALSLKT